MGQGSRVGKSLRRMSGVSTKPGLTRVTAGQAWVAKLQRPAQVALPWSYLVVQFFPRVDVSPIEPGEAHDELL